MAIVIARAWASVYLSRLFALPNAQLWCIVCVCAMAILRFTSFFLVLSFFYCFSMILDLRRYSPRTIIIRVMCIILKRCNWRHTTMLFISLQCFSSILYAFCACDHRNCCNILIASQSPPSTLPFRSDWRIGCCYRLPNGAMTFRVYEWKKNYLKSGRAFFPSSITV